MGKGQVYGKNVGVAFMLTQPELLMLVGLAIKVLFACTRTVKLQKIQYVSLAIMLAISSHANT